MGLSSAAYAAIATVIGTGVSVHQAGEARSASNKAKDVSAAQAKAKESDTTRQEIRQERVRRAQIVASAANSGVSSGSSETGSLSALGTLTGGNIAFRTGAGKANEAVSGYVQDSTDATGRSNTAAAVSSLTAPYSDFNF